MVRAEGEQDPLYVRVRNQWYIFAFALQGIVSMMNGPIISIIQMKYPKETVFKSFYSLLHITLASYVVLTIGFAVIILIILQEEEQGRDGYPKGYKYQFISCIVLIAVISAPLSLGLIVAVSEKKVQIAWIILGSVAGLLLTFTFVGCCIQAGCLGPIQTFLGNLSGYVLAIYNGFTVWFIGLGQSLAQYWNQPATDEEQGNVTPGGGATDEDQGGVPAGGGHGRGRGRGGSESPGDRGGRSGPRRGRGPRGGAGDVELQVRRRGPRKDPRGGEEGEGRRVRGDGDSVRLTVNKYGGPVTRSGGVSRGINELTRGSGGRGRDPKVL